MDEPHTRFQLAFGLQCVMHLGRMHAEKIAQHSDNLAGLSQHSSIDCLLLVCVHGEFVLVGGC